jgi:hypothetical protein
MPSNRRFFETSAQQIDPLSWFTGPLVPVSFTLLGLVYSLTLAAITWNDTDRPWIQLIAAGLCAVSGVLVHSFTRPLRQELHYRTAVLVLVPVTAGMILSAVGYADSGFVVEFWWAPGVLALTIAGLGPYLPVRHVLAVGSATALVAVVVSLAIVHPTTDRWGALGVAAIIAYPPALAIVATAVFSYSVVSTMIDMLESPSRIMVAGQTVKDAAAEHIERVTVARLTARAVPFIEAVATAGCITPADRALAGQLARRLRDELVTQSNLSWLDSVASESRLVVVDPDRRARRMNNAQRTALRGMLQAIVETPGADSGSLMIELRDGADGATAVALSLDMALPEGRRIMHLAPYYLTLGMAVDDLVVERDRLLRLSFTVPADRKP